MRDIKVLALNEISYFVKVFKETVNNKYSGRYNINEVLNEGDSASKSIDPSMYSETIAMENNKTSVIAAYVNTGRNQVEVYGLAQVRTKISNGDLSLELSQLGAFDGAGKELFQYILKTAYQMGFKYVSWQVASGSEKLRNFYRNASNINNDDYHGTLNIDTNSATFTFLRQ